MNSFLDIIEYNSEIPYLVVFLVIGVGIAMFLLSLIVFVAIDSKSYFKPFYRFVFIFLTLIFNFLGFFIYLLFKSTKGSEADELANEELFSMGLHRCEFCGSINSLENKYCTDCGKKLFKTCTKCNRSNIILSEKYCSNCGELLIKENLEDKKEIKNKKNKSFKLFSLLKNIIISFQKKLQSLFKHFKKVEKEEDKSFSNSKRKNKKK